MDRIKKLSIESIFRFGCYDEESVGRVASIIISSLDLYAVWFDYCEIASNPYYKGELMNFKRSVIDLVNEQEIRLDSITDYDSLILELIIKDSNTEPHIPMFTSDTFQLSADTVLSELITRIRNKH